MGVVAPFGPAATQEGSAYILPIPAQYRSTPITLYVTILPLDAERSRAPQQGEIRSLQLIVASER